MILVLFDGVDYSVIDRGIVLKKVSNTGQVAKLISKEIKNRGMAIDIVLIPGWDTRSYMPLTPQQRMNLIEAVENEGLCCSKIESHAF